MVVRNRAMAFIRSSAASKLQFDYQYSNSALRNDFFIPYSQPIVAASLHTDLRGGVGDLSKSVVKMDSERFPGIF
jgi:hypothetical protein